MRGGGIKKKIKKLLEGSSFGQYGSHANQFAIIKKKKKKNMSMNSEMVHR